MLLARNGDTSSQLAVHLLHFYFPSTSSAWTGRRRDDRGTTWEGETRNWRSKIPTLSTREHRFGGFRERYIDYSSTGRETKVSGRLPAVSLVLYHRGVFGTFGVLGLGYLRAETGTEILWPYLCPKYRGHTVLLDTGNGNGEAFIDCTQVSSLVKCLVHHLVGSRSFNKHAHPLPLSQVLIGLGLETSM